MKPIIQSPPVEKLVISAVTAGHGVDGLAYALLGGDLEGFLGCF